MKPSALALLLAATATSHAQWTVYDPAVHAQQIISTAQEVAKFAEMIGNQMRQIRSLEEEVSTLHHYVDLFGNPNTVHPASVGALRDDLTKPEVGRSFEILLAAADSASAMLSDGHGVFAPIGQSFLTPNEVRIERAPELYRSTAALQETTENFLAVSGDAGSRRAALKTEIARTTAALSSARTDAEVQKLNAVLVGLGTALQGTDFEVAQATASVLVQDAAARADAHRQSEARKERQAAEFTEAVTNYARTFRLLTAPAPFPTP